MPYQTGNKEKITKLTQPTTPVLTLNRQSPTTRNLEARAPRRRTHANFHGFLRVGPGNESHGIRRAIRCLVAHGAVAHVEGRGVGLVAQHGIAVQGTGGLGGYVEAVVAAAAAGSDEVEELLHGAGGGRGCEKEGGEDVHFVLCTVDNGW